ncbi:hypothetical protein PINS_up012573 [Pythium insidiosum]|nr:hypothetical protein PINS_up012573 [Pythium insidiosum]
MVKTTFPLHGYERFFSMTPGVSARVAHVLTVRGDIDALVARLPTAVLATFNEHPKMRALLLPGVTPPKVLISAPLVDVTELKGGVLSVSWREGEEQSTAWMSFVEQTAQTPVDRAHSLPFAFHVFADATTRQFARIVVLADRYMADEMSGAIVLHSLLRHAANADDAARVEEQPVLSSMYEYLHGDQPTDPETRGVGGWLRAVASEAVAKWILEPLVSFDHAGFQPVLPVDAATQRDFQGRPAVPGNPSRAQFTRGTESNMSRALAACEAQGVTLHGALVAATVLAFGLTAQPETLLQPETGGEGDEQRRVRVKTDVLCDMRQELEALRATDGSERAVGLYSMPANLVFTSSEGVDVHAERFWDVARKADRERAGVLDGHELRMQSVFVHETLHEGNLEPSLRVQQSVLSDTTVASVGLYPFDTELTLSSSATLRVESLHVYTALPSLSSASMLFVSGVSAFDYSMMSKLRNDVAPTLFHWFVQIVEALGAVDSEDSMADAAQRVAQTAAPGPEIVVVPLAMADSTQQQQQLSAQL